MNQPPPTGKRIVSKGEYAANVSKKSSLSAFGVGIMGLGFSGMVLAAFIAIVLVGQAILHGDRATLAVGAFALLIIGGGSSFLFSLGKKAVRDAKQIDPGVPLTRANTADLPASDSLVRASDAPVQEQQAVLLRAATETADGQLT